MSQKKVAPYGSWKSPITTDLILTGSIKLGQILVQLDGLDVYWDELRPSENGRNALVRWSPETGVEEVVPANFNVRNRVHEYGGGSFAVHQEVVYFSSYADQRLYRISAHAEAEPITPDESYRYANSVIDQVRNRIICVREDHTIAGQEAVNTLVALNLDAAPSSGTVLVQGNDFYASPRVSPDGTKLAWINWNHPNMPWDGTELWTADFDASGQLINKVLVAGGEDESIFQPEWSPANELHFVSDRTGWWNIYRWQDGEVQPLCPMEAEFGLPQWVFGMATYGFESAHSIICTYTENGVWHLAHLNANSGQLDPIEIPFTSISNVKVGSGYTIFTGGSSTKASSIIRLDLSTGEFEVLRESISLNVDPGYLSIPEPVEFPTAQGLSAHALYYRPRNQDYAGDPAERPPLLVISHGGPTGSNSTTLDLRTQYWTSRGIGVLDVNYGGSTGHGRAYRQRLAGQWGVVDVQDCVNGAQFLVDQNEVDGRRLAIRGGSAGGYTTLCAVTYYDLFSAGASYYGICDITVLAEETHKFESRYMDRLVGPYPQAKQRYIERSPINYIDKIHCPLILLQGLEDKVVPPSQAEMMVAALKNKGLPVAYLPFEGEQHGFRQAANIKRALEGELYFYSRIFKFELSTPVEPVHIANLDE